MPEPTPAAYRLFSWMRQGLLASISQSAGSGASGTHGGLVVPIRLRINNTRDVEMPLHLYGPGDVTGLDAREVIRTEPQPLMTDFEPNYFPSIEFDRPDFPWLFTPAVPDGNRRLVPWICLVVVRRNTATLTAGAGQSLPVLECPRRELPDLSQSWAWAHAQVVSGGATVSEPLDHAALQRVLKGSPERTLSRLLCPRRLDPNTAYYVCVVPAFDVGRRAGLGEPVTATEEAATQPAWSSEPAAGADDRVKLPVYFQWEFTTGLAGDFESLARRLEPKRLPATVGLQPMDVSNPGWGMPRLQPTAPGAVLDLDGALRAPETDPRPWPDDARASFQTRLREILNTPAVQNPSGAEAAVLAPPLYGQWYPNLQAVAAAGPPHWFVELNLDPRHRVAAGLGTAVIRFEQEQLMASAWDQLTKHEQDNQRLKRAQLAETVGEALVDKHFKGLQPDRFLQVTAPARGVLQRRRAARDSSLRTGAVPPAAFAPGAPGARPVLSAAFRRLTRSGGPLAKRLNRIGAGSRRGGAGRNFQPAMRALSFTAGAGVAGFEGQVSKTVMLAQLDPKVTVLDAVRQEMPAATSTDLVRFAPQFPQPMYEPLRDYFHGMLLPGLDHVPPNTIALLETNQPFIEAYMVGLNHKMSRELLWRGFPTDQRGTYFRQFWDVRGNVASSTPSQQEQLTDIVPIGTWLADSHLGEHAGRGKTEGHMVLLIRGDLLRRYPRALLYAVEGVWSADNKRRELGAKELYPMFRATQAPDITMLGFLLTEQQVRGADDAANEGHPGWFFVLQEQPTEPRFGLDVATTYGGRPEHWRDLTWGHLAHSEEALAQMVYVPTEGLLKDVALDSVAWGRNSAQMASITRQRPFRVAIHSRTWLSGSR